MYKDRKFTKQNYSKSYPLTKLSKGDIYTNVYVGKYQIYLYDHEL